MSSFTIHGLPVSQGIAIGYVHLVSHALLEVSHYRIPDKHLDAEVERLDDALATVQGELMGLKTAAAHHGGNSCWLSALSQQSSSGSSC